MDRTTGVLERPVRSRSTQLTAHVGCSGWFYRHWKGAFYPEDLPMSRWFSYYLQHFQTVELNAPFYRWPQPSTVKSWQRQSPEGFRYSVKVNRFITHLKRFKDTQERVTEFYGIAAQLGPKMGCFLFQLPPRYHFTSERLENLLAQLDPQYLNAVEFRHGSWWNEEVYRRFKQCGIIFCSISAPGFPSELVLTTETLYLRFHGRESWYGDEYPTTELENWAQQIKESGAREAWIYFNNDREAFAVRNARTLARCLV